MFRCALVILVLVGQCCESEKTFGDFVEDLFAEEETEMASEAILLLSATTQETIERELQDIKAEVDLFVADMQTVS
jgi:hypothetical protein